ncbi:MAG: hypothetical protein CM15mP45_04520 [Deltaproteobacteria bacterium]|nr:MAG: hypothetical protein CM15mP45_04520 [Deltaproteobacteria bacterium]
MQGVYWKNGEMIKSFLKNQLGHRKKKLGVDSSGNVYMPGWKMKTHEITHASYWKNGLLKNLTSTFLMERLQMCLLVEIISTSQGPMGIIIRGYWLHTGKMER